MKVTLKNVRDIRDNREYSIVIVDSRKTKWFVPIEEEPAAAEPEE